jgi:hypothetical protein
MEKFKNEDLDADRGTIAIGSYGGIDRWTAINLKRHL